MNNFEHRVLRIERINTAVQRCAIIVGVLDLHRDKKTQARIGEIPGIRISLVTQDAAHKEFCWTVPLNRPSRFLEQIRTQGFLRIEATAVQRCAWRALNLHRDKKTQARTRETWTIP